MKIFKFGGASVKDAAGVRNVVQVVQTMGYDGLGIVVSAMGKTTNALEDIINCYQNNDQAYLTLIDELFTKHLEIVSDLETNGAGEDVLIRFRESELKKNLKATIESLKGTMLRNQSKNHAFIYDQVVSHGELLSTKIVASYFNANEIPVDWMDARQLIKTDQKYRDAAVDWKKTEKLIKNNCTGKLFLTQGFIGSDDNGFTTTLGREGSDYTAAILAYALDASHVTIWKDVPGVLNGDPRVFENTVLLEQISYREAIELAFYGASVIHPKTLQPLQGKQIELRVNSFLDPQSQGTVIKDGDALKPMTPCYIVRKNLVFLEISARDFSFIGEHNISDIFHQLSESKMEVGLLQNSAISFTICVEDKYGKLSELLDDLEARYKVNAVSDVSLYTIRHHSDNAIESIENGKEVLLRQRTQETLQLVVKG
ncbi:aspartate kinase [Nonlabens ulvanivorans]|uniref:Aspartokinase n=1 Tax=Nonlabens ulvanivorans TaxID=906888 RepID=A0A084JT78_NONUL|nr:aspartate kinase [Nonlabens ulvanivorans]KEZ92162.1 aspartate kinase [Nonlabens ulvanivorans]PRX14990.1 aspartate kinase [Nonlabens ulvanivorans]